MAAHFPGETKQMQEADAAIARRDFAGALRLLAAEREAHPDEAAAYARAADILRKQKRLEEAAAVCDAGLARCRGAGLPALLVQRARVAQAAGDLAGALERWRAARARKPDLAAAYVGEAACLQAMGRLDEAEYLAIYTVAKFPDHAAASRQAGAIAAARGEWAEARARFDRVLAQRPDDAAARRGRDQAVARLGAPAASTDADDDEDDHRIVEITQVDDPAARALVMGFESLGQNCEFGLVQRRFGAEPLGLLRWANTKPASLAAYLETRFAGIAEPGKLTHSRTSSGENLLTDHSFGQVFHTFQRDEIADEADYLRRHAARLGYLRDKLVSELDTGEKIFVYKPSLAANAGTEARLVAAFRGYAGATLLWVDLADGAHAPGSVRDCGAGLLRGHLSRRNPVRPGQWDIPFSEWLRLCEGARAIVGGSTHQTLAGLKRHLEGQQDD